MVVVDEGFDDITTLPGGGWLEVNNSDPIGTIGWFQGNDTVFPAFDGAPTAYIGVNFNSTSGTGTISNWLVTPPITFSSGASASFYTTTLAGSSFPDRLQVRLCTADPCTNVGTSATDVGDFTTLLLDINPTYAVGGYPEAWTQYTINTGLPSSGTGRIAFRYFVEGGGPSGANSNYIGIDRVTIDNGTGGGGCSAPSDVPWLSVSPTSGSVAGGNADDVTVGVDSTGLAPGSYTAHMCVTTNDPGNALVDVPVSLTVTGGTITHTVTPSVGTPSGTITPDTPQTVDDGDSILFTLTPDAGFQIGDVGGTCGGTLAGNVFTTNPVTADCTVIANFANDTIFEDGFDGP
ncbi:MAG: choice-of-anchor J domain-containing protein [Lysobacterales bacterium]